MVTICVLLSSAIICPCHLLLPAGIVVSDLLDDSRYLELHRGYMCSGQQLLQLVADCAAADIAFCNVHPKNLLLVPPRGRAADAGCTSPGPDWQLVLLDVGRDWRPAAWQPGCKLADR